MSLLQPHKLVAMHSLGMVFAMGVCLLAALGCVSGSSLPHSTTLVAEFVTADFDWTDVPPGVKEDFAVENCTITGVKVCTVAVLCTPCGHVWRPPVAVCASTLWYYCPALSSTTMGTTTSPSLAGDLGCPPP